MTRPEPAAITGWCSSNKHDRCGFVLRAATGWNWWCACLCHPEPVIEHGRADFQQAFEHWTAQRAAHAGSTP